MTNRGRQLLGISLLSLGTLSSVIGLFGLINDSADGEPVAATAAAPSTSAPSTSASAATVAPTTEPPETTAPTTSAAPANTTAAVTITTTTPPDQTVEDFFPDFVAAIESGDVDFLLARLHPVVLEQPNADRCRTFIEREILALGNYTLTGDVTGPVSQNVAGTTVAAVYSAPVSFVFQGQSFDGTATFAAVDGEMRWFTECR